MEKKENANFKGVMLCNRPNFEANLLRNRPFVSRVDKKESLGINPIKKIPVNRPKKFVNTAILKHKLWLDEFKEKVKETREMPCLDGKTRSFSKKRADFEAKKAEIERFFEKNAEKQENAQELADFMKNLEYNKEILRDAQVKSLVSSLRAKIQKKSSEKPEKVKKIWENSAQTLGKPQENEEKLAKCIAKELLKDKSLLNKLHSATSLRNFKERARETP